MVSADLSINDHPQDSQCHTGGKVPRFGAKYFKGLWVVRFHVAYRGTFLLCDLQIKDTFWIMQEYSQLSKADDFNANMQEVMTIRFF